jgi:chromosome segregation ATPase
MNSISKRALQLKQKKIRSSKIRNKTLRALKTAKSLHRKSTSAINSMQRGISKIRSELDEVSNKLQHSLAQKESIQRLKINAEQRLKQEKERKKQIEQEISSATDEVKDRLEFTLGTISDEINEIRNEIRLRNSTAKKIDKIIEEFNTKKSKLCGQIKRNLQSKPQLVKIVNESKKNMAKLEKRLPSLTIVEKNVRKNFSRINLIMKEHAKKKEESKAKLRRIKSRRAAEEKRIQNLARKLATQMLSEKRKASRKPKAKRKASRKPKAKRKASRKPKAKRKASRKPKAKRKASRKRR